MAGSRDGDIYEDPALEDETAFRDLPPSPARITRADLMTANERFGDPIEEGTAPPPAVPDDLAPDASAGHCDERKWTLIMENFRQHVRAPVPTGQTPDGSMTTTIIIDALRTDDAFFRHIFEYIQEEPQEDELRLIFPGYNTDYTIYTLAFKPEWLTAPVNLYEFLPLVQLGPLGADSKLKTIGDVKEARMDLARVLGQAVESYIRMRGGLFKWWADAKKKDTPGCIDLFKKRCKQIQYYAFRVFCFTERLLQDIQGYIARGEVKKRHIDSKFPKLKGHLCEMLGAALFTHLDGHTEAARVQRQNGEHV